MTIEEMREYTIVGYDYEATPARCESESWKRTYAVCERLDAQNQLLERIAGALEQQRVYRDPQHNWDKPLGLAPTTTAGEE